MAHPWGYVSLNSSLRIEDVIVQESIVGSSHLAMLRRIVIVPYVGVSASMQGFPTIALFKVKDCKRAHVSNTIHMDGELPEEIYNLVAAIRQTKPENERCNDDAENLLEEDHNFQLIKCRKLSLDLIAV